jgi:hypothetical protein
MVFGRETTLGAGSAYKRLDVLTLGSQFFNYRI